MMTNGTIGQVWLNRQADRIEHTLSSLAMPVRVSGGNIREGRVRYHLTPLGATQLDALEGVGPALATALGAEQVRVAREIGGLAMEVLGEPEEDLRLLPLMHAIGRLEPMTAVVGMTAEGRPLTFSLSDQGATHLLVQGPAGSGKSELLRTALISLALTSRPAQLQIIGFDFNEQQLTCLEALPHALTEVAAEPGFALELLEWLAEEVERRRRYRMVRPALLLLVDGLDQAPAEVQQNISKLMTRLNVVDCTAGIHMMATGRHLQLSREPHGIIWVEAGKRTGAFTFNSEGQTMDATICWLPIRDLATAVTLAAQSPGAVDRRQLTAVLSERPQTHVGQS